MSGSAIKGSTEDAVDTFKFIATKVSEYHWHLVFRNPTEIGLKLLFDSGYWSVVILVFTAHHT